MEHNQVTWHALTPQDALERTDSSPEGLTQKEAETRLQRDGPNAVGEEEEISPWKIFFSQFHDFLIYLLLGAALLSVVVGFLPGAESKYKDAVLILSILVANGIFGFIQDYRAEKSIQALKQMSTPKAKVLREGSAEQVQSREVVVGDVILLEEGDRVPADGRILKSETLSCSEAELTGESEKAIKTSDEVSERAPLAERSSMVYSGTHVVEGHGRAVVVATGLETEVGKIARQIRETEERKTPFQIEVDRLGRRIAVAVAVLILVTTLIQALFTSAPPITIFLVAVTLAVAAVPEGLPAVVTLTLAMGTRRMLARNALVRRLPVVESLGSVDLIISDKTGTLTENRMTVRRVYVSGEAYRIKEGKAEPLDSEVDLSDREGLESILTCAWICNNAELESGADSVLGDPTEVALKRAARDFEVQPEVDRAREITFSTERKRMTVVTEQGSAYMKGAPEVVLGRCSRRLLQGQEKELSDEQREDLLAVNREFASQAYRVLAFSRREVSDVDAASDEELEEAHLFLGFLAMMDPPREGVAEAIRDCHNAGIRVVMITGDNLATAKAIAGKIGLSPDGAMEGREVEDLDPEELRERVEKVEVFARAVPSTKVRLLEALRANGHRLAMTGDGVNDAPALKKADVGIAMGRQGTDVAREASDMILQDDNFATIRDAVAEGRGIFDNLRKFVNFQLSTHTAEILIVLFGVIIGSAFFPEAFASHSEALILTPVMLLWINLVTDGLPAVALGLDPKAENVLVRDPRPADEPVIHRPVLLSIAVIGSWLAAAGLLLFFYGLHRTAELPMAQTLLFTFLVVSEMAVIQVIRRRYGLSVFSNRWLIGAIGLTLILQVLVLYTAARPFFEVARLGWEEWQWILLVLAGFALLNFVSDGLLRRHLRSDP